MPKAKGRPKFGYFVFDLPSDHEINETLVTESDVIRSVLANRALGTQVKSLKFTTASSFKDCPERKYSGIRYVHLGGHGGHTGIGFIGGTVPWATVAEKLTKLFTKLSHDEQHVLTLSCCHSSHGVAAMRTTLRGYFTAIYHFEPEKIGFSTAMTTWSMFYLKKNLTRPHSAIKKDINSFLGSNTLRFVAP